MRSVLSRIFRLVVLCSFLFPCLAMAQQNAGQAQVRSIFVNQDVAQMVKSRFADSTIIKLITANETNFDLSVPAMIKLKNAGVSQAVIETMISAGANKKAAAPVKVEVAPQPAPPPSSAKNADLPDEIGVYVRSNG